MPKKNPVILILRLIFADYQYGYQYIFGFTCWLFEMGLGRLMLPTLSQCIRLCASATFAPSIAGSFQ